MSMIENEEDFIRGMIITVRVVEVINKEYFIIAYKGSLFRVKNQSAKKIEPKTRITLQVEDVGHFKFIDYEGSKSRNHGIDKMI